MALIREARTAAKSLRTFAERGRNVLPLPGSMDSIAVRGAREHNLKNTSLEIPRSQRVVIAGVSGSGKASRAFDTLFAEGQRRYVESLMSYTRQFLRQMEKAGVDSVEGLARPSPRACGGSNAPGVYR